MPGPSFTPARAQRIEHCAEGVLRRRCRAPRRGFGAGRDEPPASVTAPAGPGARPHGRWQTTAAAMCSAHVLGQIGRPISVRVAELAEPRSAALWRIGGDRLILLQLCHGRF